MFNSSLVKSESCVFSAGDGFSSGGCEDDSVPFGTDELVFSVVELFSTDDEELVSMWVELFSSNDDEELFSIDVEFDSSNDDEELVSM